MQFPQTFVLKHTLPDFKNAKPNDFTNGNTETHFDVPWRIQTFKKENETGFYLECLKSRLTDGWLVNADVQLKLFKNNTPKDLVKVENHRFPSDSLELEAVHDMVLQLSHSDDGVTLNIEVHVTINAMEGMRPILKQFDESNQRFSDVKLVVQGQKFYVLKSHLASHSPVFESMFFGVSADAGKSEFELDGIDPYGFQKFLEVTNGEPAVNDDTVEEILKLADLFRTRTVVRSCEEYLIRVSQKPLKMKFQAAIKHKMERLKNKCLHEMKTVVDIESVLPENIEDFAKQDYVDLVRKAVALNKSSA